MRQDDCRIDPAVPAHATQPTHATPPAPAHITPAAPAGTLLMCVPCNKGFNVRGAGEVSYRLIPCPNCGSPMQPAGGRAENPLANDANWVPIISVLCKGCHGLIDVPYASIGKTIDCPRCQAELTVPAVENPLDRNRQMSMLA